MYDSDIYSSISDLIIDRIIDSIEHSFFIIFIDNNENEILFKHTFYSENQALRNAKLFKGKYKKAKIISGVIALKSYIKKNIN